MPRTSERARLIVFARAPIAGATKTRLIPLLGAPGAASLHERLIEHALATAQRAAVGPVELHGAPADNDFLRACAARFGVTLVEQCEGDLGERMRRALEGGLTRTPRVLLIGSDCPALTATHLRRAADALGDRYDAVFAPTEDGGYALIGVTRMQPALFSGIAWSTPSVMPSTRDRLRDLQWRWFELETLWDVDTPADYLRLLASGLLNEVGDRTP